MGKAKDYTGHVFGRLTAIERISEKGERTKYRCLCVCGVEIITQSSGLASGHAKSCGCLQKEAVIDAGHKRLGARKDRPPRDDLTGSRFGRLLVESFSHKDKNTQATWNCICDCGNTLVVVANSLKSGHTKSCGCFNKERVIQAVTTHGDINSLTYSSWKAMWQRCTNPNHNGYAKYQHRLHPDEWRNYSIFLRDMGPRPSAQHSIDRIDNDAAYGPSNCRWATVIEQANNKSTSNRKYDANTNLS